MGKIKTYKDIGAAKKKILDGWRWSRRRGKEGKRRRAEGGANK